MHGQFIENTSHGTPAFPLALYVVDGDHPKYIMAAHWHREFEIIFVESGVLEVYLENQSHIIGAGDYLLIGGGQLHRAHPHNCRYHCLVFDAEMLIHHPNDAVKKYIYPFSEMPGGVRPRVARGDREVRAALKHLFDRVEGEDFCREPEVYAALFLLVAVLHRFDYIAASGGVSAAPLTTIKSITDRMEKTFTEPFSLEALAQGVGLNKKYLCRLFKKYTGKTPVEYVNELRIERACYELTVRGKNITEAAFDSGFNNLSYFCKMFRRIKGMTPKEYKAQTENLL